MTTIELRSKIKIGNGETTNVVCQLVLTHLTVKFTDVSFFGYFCLLIITTKAIIKANVMIDIPILYSIYLQKTSEQIKNHKKIKYQLNIDKTKNFV